MCITARQDKGREKEEKKKEKKEKKCCEHKGQRETRGGGGAQEEGKREGGEGKREGGGNAKGAKRGRSANAHTRHTQSKSVKSDTRVVEGGKATHICPPAAHCENPATCKMRLTRRDQILSIIVGFYFLAGGTSGKWRQNLTSFSQRGGGGGGGANSRGKFTTTVLCVPGGMNYNWWISGDENWITFPPRGSGCTTTSRFLCGHRPLPQHTP